MKAEETAKLINISAKTPKQHDNEYILLLQI